MELFVVSSLLWQFNDDYMMRHAQNKHTPRLCGFQQQQRIIELQFIARKYPAAILHTHTHILIHQLFIWLLNNMYVRWAHTHTAPAKND